jgi:hypothetical protein
MMKSITTALVLSIGLLASGAVQAQNYSTDWSQFSEALEKAAAHDNYGVKLGAIQQIAIYGSHLDVDGATFDVVRVYRNSKSVNERILALSALAKMNNAWSIDFLSRSVGFEKNERVRAITIDVVNQYRLGLANPESGNALAAWEAQLVPPTASEIGVLLAAK